VLNRIILIGRLTRDPELRYVPSGQPVASFTLAVDRPFVNQQGSEGQILSTSSPGASWQSR